jgi:hypothetical protein
MPNIEILFYSPLNMRKFIDFCLKGKETSPGSGVAAKDEEGNDIFGVISWLNGWGVPEAHFFHTPLEKDDDPQADKRVKIFMALVTKNDDDPTTRPWFSMVAANPPKITLHPDIPGINKVLRVDGELGMLDEPTSIQELLALITNDKELDAEFAALRARTQDTLKQLEGDKAGRRRFLAALRGEGEIKPAADVLKELKFSLRE